MKLRTVHQFHPTIAPGDAIGNDCLELQDLLSTAGVRSGLFAAEARPELRGFVRDWRELAAEPIDRAAVGETVAGAGVLLREKDLAAAAEACALVVEREDLRSALIAAGLRRVADFAADIVAERTRAALGL